MSYNHCRAAPQPVIVVLRTVTLGHNAKRSLTLANSWVNSENAP